jgi:hypothetical protein
MPPRESNKISAGRTSEFKKSQQIIEKKAPGTQTVSPARTVVDVAREFKNKAPKAIKQAVATELATTSKYGTFNERLAGNVVNAASDVVQGAANLVSNRINAQAGSALIPNVKTPKLNVSRTDGFQGIQGGSLNRNPEIGTASSGGLEVPGNPDETFNRTLEAAGMLPIPGIKAAPAVASGAKVALKSGAKGAVEGTKAVSKTINTATTIPSRSLRKEKSVFPASFYPEGAVSDYVDPKKIDRTSGFYHGSASAQPGPFTPRGPQNQNLLAGDAFFTDTPGVAKTYTSGSTEGMAGPQTWDKVYKAQGLQDKKLLDLYPQGKTLASQDPKLYKRIIKDIKENAYPEDSVGVGDPNWTKEYGPDGLFVGERYKGKKPYSQEQANQWVDNFKATEGGFGRARHKAVTTYRDGEYLYPDSGNTRFSMLNDMNEKTGNVVANSALGRGWDGFTHEGGRIMGDQPHQVAALWDAKGTGIAKVPDAETTLPAVTPVRTVEAPGSWKPSRVSQQWSKIVTPKLKAAVPDFLS